MEETSEEMPNFSIAIDLLGPDPTSSKNKAELRKKKNSQVARFANLSKTSCSKFWPKDIHWEQNRHQLAINKAKFPFLLLFLNLLCTLLSPDNPTEAGKFLSQ